MNGSSGVFYPITGQIIDTLIIINLWNNFLNSRIKYRYRRDVAPPDFRKLYMQKFGEQHI